MPPSILPGSLYHHFESKEAILVELLRRYHDDLDRIAEHAQRRLDDPRRCPRLIESSIWARRSRNARSHTARHCR